MCCVSCKDLDVAQGSRSLSLLSQVVLGRDGAELGAAGLLGATALGTPTPALLIPPAARLLLVVLVNGWTWPEGSFAA